LSRPSIRLAMIGGSPGTSIPSAPANRKTPSRRGTHDAASRARQAATPRTGGGVGQYRGHGRVGAGLHAGQTAPTELVAHARAHQGGGGHVLWRHGRSRALGRAGSGPEAVPGDGQRISPHVVAVSRGRNLAVTTPPPSSRPSYLAWGYLRWNRGRVQGGSIRVDLVPAPHMGEPAHPTCGSGISHHPNHPYGKEGALGGRHATPPRPSRPKADGRAHRHGK
jgi:hypothetical protein